MECWLSPKNCKTENLTWWKERERLENQGLQNVQKWKAHVQRVLSYFMSLLNMQICDVLLNVVVVADWATNYQDG